jgi:DNA-binding XRE family transcriptional regulator
VQLPRLRYRRKRALLTQAELADQAGLNRKTIYALERGGEASRDTIVKLARALQCDPHDLMPPEQN